MAGVALGLLYVCTGNICRSPLAERLTLLRLTGHGLAGCVAVTSAGVRAVEGSGMDAAAAAALRRRGGDPEGFVARGLSPEAVDRADLVLTMTRAHRTRLLQDSPRALRRTFTLPEAADLARRTVDVPVHADLRDWVATMAVRRGQATPADHDVVDPIGRGENVHEQAAATITAAVDALLEQLVPRLLASHG